jgi:hypothetical protein
MNQSLASHGGATPAQAASSREAAIASITEFLAFKLGAEEYGIDGPLRNPRVLPTPRRSSRV